MLIASSIVKVVPEKAEEVRELLNQIPKVTTYGIHKESNIIIVAEAHDVEQLESLNNYILEQFPDVLAVFPTYLTSDEESQTG
jgi:nitrate reductase NapAB chaperone NapD